MMSQTMSHKQGLNLQGTRRSADSDQIEAWGVFFLALGQQRGSGVTGHAPRDDGVILALYV